MGVSLLTDDADYLTKTMGANDPATGIEPGSMFDNFLGATFVQGPVGGIAAAGIAGVDAATTMNAYAGVTAGGMSLSPLAMVSRGYDLFNQTYEQTSGEKLDIRGQLQAMENWAKIDPREVGAVGRTLGSVTRGLTVFGLGTLAGGPVAGASLVGSTEGYQTYRDMRAEGVDAGTAAAAGVVTGVTSGAGALLPATVGAKSVFGMAASGAAINTGFGALSRGSVGAVLEANGYTEMADRYRILDAEAIAADAILGAAFGPLSKYLDKKPGGEDKPKPTPEQILDALEIVRQEQNARGTFGLPINEEAMALDAELSDRALAAVLSGQPLEIDAAEARIVVDNTIVDPQSVSLLNSYNSVIREALGDLADIGEPPTLLDEPAAPPPAKDVAEQAAPPMQKEALKDFDPMVAEQIDKLSQMAGAADTIEMPDGSFIPMSLLKDKIIENMALAEKDAGLFDVAVACVLRTE